MQARRIRLHVHFLYRWRVRRLGNVRRLRVPLFASEFHCPCCNGIVDRFGDHCISCEGGGDRTRRHNMVRNETFHFATSAGQSPELEKPGLLRLRPADGTLSEDGHRDHGGSSPEHRRPADVYLPRWHQGTPAALDFAVTSGLRPELITASAQDGSAAATIYEDMKSAHLETFRHCRAEGIRFIPIVMEASGGGWGPQAHLVWAELAKCKSIVTGEPEATTASQLLQNLSCILHHENARAIMRRSTANHYIHHSDSIVSGGTNDHDVHDYDN